VTSELNGIHPNRIDLLGCPIDALDMDATLRRCMELIDAGGRSVRQVSVNAAKVVQWEEDAWLREFVRGSDVISADGQSVVWASRLLGHPVPERVAGIDLMGRLMAEAERRGLGIYVLGAREPVLERALARIGQLHPRLRIAGAMHGYFGADEVPGVVAGIRQAAPDLLFVAMPSPMKENWLDVHLEETGVPFGMGVGGSIDVLAGEYRRAPEWMQRWGGEWLFRMMQDPRRMWRRYLVGNLRFGWIVVRAMARGRASTQGSVA
jgi:N-acetylglucosaminyldiphosphoundecaprenol N-acetyl-beta-D-mannosaminyltransferase